MLGISSPKFCIVPFETIIEKIAPHFELFEIIGEGKHYLPAIKSQLIELMPSYNLELLIHAPMSDINIGSLNPGVKRLSLEIIYETLCIARELNISLVSLHPGNLSPLGYVVPHVARKTNIESLRTIANWGRELNVQIAVENLPLRNWTLCNTAEELIEAINNLDLGICFDIGHANVIGEIDTILTYGDRILNVHVHDNDGTKDLHWVLGKGNIDFKRVLTTILTKYNYRGNFIIEANSVEEGIASKRILHRLLTEILHTA